MKVTTVPSKKKSLSIHGIVNILEHVSYKNKVFYKEFCLKIHIFSIKSLQFVKLVSQ